MGYLMRRNILAYMAPLRNEGYDIICVNPDLRQANRRMIRVQVKSRAWDENDRSVQMKKRGLRGFDYLVAVFMNIKRSGKKKHRAIAFFPEFYTVSRKWVQNNFRSYGKHGKLFFPKRGMEKYQGLKGFEKIAQDLRVSY
jgi:hypothetical protein